MCCIQVLSLKVKKIVEKRESNKMSAEEAVQVVINQENLDEYPQLIVEHDHNEIIATSSMVGRVLKMLIQQHGDGIMLILIAEM